MKPTIEKIEFVNTESWLQERMKDITSTEVSALYGLSPYLTEYELFHTKKDGVVVRIEENERMTWGKRLESSIAIGAAEDSGWTVSKLGCYMRQPDARIGSSFDFIIDAGHSSGRSALLEIKNVDSLAFNKNWIDDGAGNIEAPEHIELQIQHQMEVADIDYCVLVALVGGNRKVSITRLRDREIGADIRAKVKAFWQRVDSNSPPSADYTKDADFIIDRLSKNVDANLIAKSDESLDALIQQYRHVSAEADSYDDLKKATKAQILERIGGASKVLSPLGSITCGFTKDSVGTMITQDMVGTLVGSRKGYRMFKFTAKKEG